MNANIKTANRIPRTLSTAMLLMCVCTFSGAFADEPVRSERVKFQDLNVDTPEGVQALYGRIHAAAGRVCSESDPIMRQAVASAPRRRRGTRSRNSTCRSSRRIT